MTMGMEQDELNAILEEFFTEADENLDAFEQDLIQLEALAEDGSATDKETIDRLFRGLHTLKGGAGFLGLEKMAKLAHAGENLLDEVRNAKVPVTKPVMDALLQASDGLKELLKVYKAREDDGALDYTDLINELNRLVESGGQPSAGAAPAAASAPAPAAPAAGAINQDLMNEIMADDSLDPSKDKGEDAPPGAKPAAPAVAVNQDLLNEIMADDSLDPSKDKGEDGPPGAKPAAAPAVASPVAVNQDLLKEIMADDSLDPSKDKGEDVPPGAKPAAAPAAPAAAPAAGVKPPPSAIQDPAAAAKAAADKMAAAKKASGEEGGETIRVETARLDKVMNLVGELVLARNSLLRQLNTPQLRTVIDNFDEHGIIGANLEQLARVTQDLQMSVLSTRMQPIKKVFDKIPRQVRELKTKLKKEVNLIIEGENTEVDKSLVEDLADPMVHMIRNALDHGIETPDEREMSGKHPEGTLVVRAFYEGNNVVIQVQEDGKGIDPEKIKKVAIKKGIISEATASTMQDADAIRLIMAPGFSTAEQITDVSGRGVGMDVVNSKIIGLQGSLDIRSEAGVGTCFSIYLPLTLAIVNALIVGSNEEGFAIPIGDISEVIKFAPQGIHKVNSQDIIELRGEPLPLYYLGKLTRDGVLPTMPQDHTGDDDDKREAPLPPPLASMSLDDLDAISRANSVAMPAAAKSKKPATSGFVVVVRDGNSAMGLVVDALLGQEEVVVKPVSDVFAYNKAISGATITGDGKVHMILDVPFLLKDLSALRA